MRPRLTGASPSKPKRKASASCSRLAQPIIPEFLLKGKRSPVLAPTFSQGTSGRQGCPLHSQGLHRITTPCRTAEDVLLLDGTCRGRLQYGQSLAVADLARL